MEYLKPPTHSKEPDLVYYNLDIINNKTIVVVGGTDPKASFNESRDTPIIKNNSDYLFSIVRFTMDGCELPMFIPSMKTGGTVNDLVYSVTLTAEDVSGDAFTSDEINLIYVSQNSIEPPSSTDKQDLSSKYYWIQNYQQVVDMVNVAFETAWTNVKAKADAVHSGVFTGVAPKMVFNEANTTFDIWYDSTAFGSQSTQQSRLYANSDFYGLFKNYNGEKTGTDPQYFYYYSEIMPTIDGTSNELSYDGVDYIAMKQNFKSVNNIWSPIGSIVFSSTLIPVVQEEVAPPVIIGQGNNNISTDSRSAFQPIVSDIVLGLDAPHDYLGFIEYIPSEYRMNSFTGANQEIRHIDMQIFWKHRLTGELYPIDMANQGSVSVKIMFRKKHL